MTKGETMIESENFDNYEKDDSGNPLREITDQFDCGHFTNWQVTYDKGKTWHPYGYCRKCNH